MKKPQYLWYIFQHKNRIYYYRHFEWGFPTKHLYSKEYNDKLQNSLISHGIILG